MLAHQPVHPLTSTDQRFKAFINRAVYFAGLFGPLMTVPQIVTIFVTRSAEDINIWTWSGYVLVAVLWLAYGIIHRTPPLIIGNTAWIIAQGAVVLGSILYGHSPNVPAS